MDVHGGGIDINLLAANSTTNVTIMDSNFFSNRALYGGAVCTVFSGINSNSIFNVVGSVFQSNFACTRGGAMSFRAISPLQHDQLNSTGKVTINSCTFKNNTAYLGGAVSVHRCQSCANITLLARDSNWTWNNANISGFGLHIGGNRTTTDLDNPYQVLGYHLQASLDNCMFVSNTNNAHFQNINAVGALQVTACDLTFTGNTEFVSNRGTALVLKALSRVTFFGNVLFEENFGINGGAIELVKASQIRINSTCNLLFTRNNAIVKGGAIYSKGISETHVYPPVPCPFDFHDTGPANVTFEHNVASNSNQSIYIGNHHECNLNVIIDWTYIPITIGQIQTLADIHSLLTRPALTNGTLWVMLGEVFYLLPIVLDAFNSTSSSSFGFLALLSSQYFKSLEYTLIGPSSLTFDSFTQNTQFYIKGPEIQEDTHAEFVIEYIYEQVTTFRSKSAELKVEVVPCKLGYNYSYEDEACVCVNDGRKDIFCPYNSSLAMACLRKGYWYDTKRMKAVPCPVTNCDYRNGKCKNEGCPTSPGYCVVENSDDSCWTGRGGYLCSKCEDDYAFNFGAFKCAPKSTCDARFLFVTMLIILVYWVFLVVVILVILSLQLSVGSGFMYGLVYYFSVISLLSDKSIYDEFLQSIITMCRSLTQMDPHFITRFMNICFIKGMDDPLYHLVLRYITPVFEIFAILAIVKLSHSRYCYLPRSISLAENSPIHAICMLVLFAYTSLSLTNIQILRPVIVGNTWYVYASPRTKYFNLEKHMPYALLAIAFELLISWPICLLLLLAPCLSRKIDLVRFRLKPIVDELQACYRPECRWFAGFYFLARQLMYLVCLIPQQDLPQSNALRKQYICVLLLLIHTIFQPYKKKWLNVLDTFFLIDILILSLYVAVPPGTVQHAALNDVLYRATPYLLILFPSCYLFGAVAALPLKKLYTWLTARGEKSRLVEATGQDSHPDPHNDLTDSFFNDEGEREPLLATTATNDRSSSPHLRTTVTHTVFSLKPSS